VTAAVSDKLAALSAMSYDEIAALPNHSEESMDLDGTRIALAVWHDILPSNEHPISVQAYKPGKLGIGRMHADGFVVNSGNQQRSLTQDEWAPFS
jgi:hypothetical protein